MRRRNMKAVAGAAALVSSISVMAQAGSVVIGNWEQQTDGWFDWPTSGGTNYNPPPVFPGEANIPTLQPARRWAITVLP